MAHLEHERTCASKLPHEIRGMEDVMTNIQRNRLIDVMEKLDDLLARIERLERRLDAVEQETKGTR